MIFKIEQLDLDDNYWYEVGETMSVACALNICKELKKENKKLYFRIIKVVDVI